MFFNSFPLPSVLAFLASLFLPFFPLFAVRREYSTVTLRPVLPFLSSLANQGSLSSLRFVATRTLRQFLAEFRSQDPRETIDRSSKNKAFHYMHKFCFRVSYFREFLYIREHDFVVAG